MALYSFTLGIFLPGLPTAIAEPQSYGAATVGQGKAADTDPNVEYYGASTVGQGKAEVRDPNVEHYGASAVGASGPAKGDLNVTTYGNSTVTLRQSDCRLLQKYVPAPDVAFTPGAGAGGAKIAPADLYPSAGIGDIKDLAFTFSVRLERPLPSGNSGNLAGDVLGEAPIGQVSFKNGVVSFNGVPISDDQAQGLSEGCKGAMEKHEKPTRHKPKPKAQKPHNP